MSTESQNGYMLLFRGTHWDKGLSPEQIQNMVTRWYAWFDQLTQEGRCTTGHPLERQGKIVSGRKGRTVADGPFAESKEIGGGYAIIDAKSRDEALAIARRFMDLHRRHWPTFEGECEMRPFEEEAQQAS